MTPGSIRCFSQCQSNGVALVRIFESGCGYKALGTLYTGCGLRGSSMWRTHSSISHSSISLDKLPFTP